MQNYYYIRLNFILSIHKLSNFPNNKLHFNNQQNQSIETIYKTNLPLLSPQGDKLSKLVKFSNRISSNLKSSINLAPSSVSQIATWNSNQRNGCRKRSFKCTPEANLVPERPTLGTLLSTATRNYLSRCIRARVCVCVVRDHSESRSFLFSRNRRRPRWPHWLLEIHRKHGIHAPPLFPLSRGRVLASRGRFSCPGISRCTAKINSPCASELHLFVFLGCYLNVRACVYE